MKRLLKLPLYIKILIIILITASVLIVAFTWPVNEKTVTFSNPILNNPTNIADTLTQYVRTESAKIDEANRLAEEAKKAAAQPKPKPTSIAQAVPKLYTGAHVRFGYLHGDPTAFIAQIEASGGGVNIVSPAWFTANADGSITDRGSSELATYAHSKGISVIPFINGNAGPILQSPSGRSRLVNDIANKVQLYNVEGINIDFEGTDITKDALNAFMQELTAKLHSFGKLSTIAVAAKTSDSQSWLNRVDYRFLGQTTDYVVIMAYDEHYRGSAPGPIASIGWFNQVAAYTANTIARDKVIMGIPFYGRHWINGADGTGLAYSNIMALIAPFGSPIQWQANNGVPYASYNDGSWHEIYFENAQSIQLKANTLLNFGFRGAAFWRLGQEDPGVWPVIKNTIKS